MMPQAARTSEVLEIVHLCSAIWGQDEADLGTSSQHHQLDLLVALYCKWGRGSAIKVAFRSSSWAANIQVVVPVHLAGGDTGVQVGESSLLSLSVAGEGSSEELSEGWEGLDDKSEEGGEVTEEVEEGGGEEWEGFLEDKEEDDVVLVHHKCAHLN